MSERNNCMYLLPPELTGRSFHTCGMFQNVCAFDMLGRRCVGYKAHTKESKQALAEAIEIKRKEREAKGGASC